MLFLGRSELLGPERCRNTGVPPPPRPLTPAEKPHQGRCGLRNVDWRSPNIKTELSTIGKLICSLGLWRVLSVVSKLILLHSLHWILVDSRSTQCLYVLGQAQ